MQIRKRTQGAEAALLLGLRICHYERKRSNPYKKDFIYFGLPRLLAKSRNDGLNFVIMRLLHRRLSAVGNVIVGAKNYY